MQKVRKQINKFIYSFTDYQHYISSAFSLLKGLFHLSFTVLVRYRTLN